VENKRGGTDKEGNVHVRRGVKFAIPCRGQGGTNTGRSKKCQGDDRVNGKCGPVVKKGTNLHSYLRTGGPGFCSWLDPGIETNTGKGESGEDGMPVLKKKGKKKNIGGLTQPTTKKSTYGGVT